MAKRGLASANRRTRQRVARMGGEASHGGGRKSPGGKYSKGSSRRGFAAMSPEKRREIARKGGEAHGKKNKNFIERLFNRD